MNDEKTVLNGEDIEKEKLADWRVLFGVLHARFETGDFATGLKLVDAIGKDAEKMNHHPDVDLTYPQVDVRLTSHDAGGVTSRDIELARTISKHAEKLGAGADTSTLQVAEWALDTHDRAEIKDFWAAVTGMSASDDDDQELTDGGGRTNTVWFQKSEATGDAPAQRWHLDVRVPPEQAEPRVKAALEAGGELVTDEHAPRFWVLADQQGNKACITTWQGRDYA